MKYKILYVNGGSLDYGGISSFMLNYLSSFSFKKIEVDIVVHGMEEGERENIARKMGCKIYHLPRKNENLIENIKGLNKIFSMGKYEIIHSHMDAMNGFVLKKAYHKIPIRISHSHNTNYLTNNWFKRMINEYQRKQIPQYATHLFACSKSAGEWLYGKDLVMKNRVRIIKNAIRLENFQVDNEVRKLYRKKYKIEDKFVVGHVGRFDYQKNHEFIIEIFFEISQRVPNSVLLLIGNGFLKEKIQKRVISLQLVEKVYFLGERKDISALLQAMDVFLFPSLFEGLPITLIEAQTVGLPCFVSSNVSEEVKVTEELYFLDLKDTAREWANRIIECNRFNGGGDNKYDLVKKAGYDIKSMANYLEEFYIQEIEEKLRMKHNFFYKK